MTPRFSSQPVSLLIAGLPGRMAREVVLAVQQEAAEEFRPLAVALSATTRAEAVVVGGHPFRTAGTGERNALTIPEGTIAVDFTQPDAALPNLEWYIARRIPVVMGTTGFDGARARAIVEGGGVPAVIAPNMAIPIVLLQAAMRWLAEEFPEALAGYGFQLTESHQQGKKDTSGTAKALVEHLARLGLPARADGIRMIRDPEEQSRQLGVAERHLSGHAYHFYHAQSPDGSLTFDISHKVHGRRAYAQGALQAVRFLAAKAAEKVGGKVYGMEDVLRGAC